ncbi:TadE/TadG family type IV pilus assembly protein [Dietzia cercidiphylli]|uniref:TadE/TadG family type IV pilus assembly protein n=1 Tax=Dietzia cercidiphylli TaxID=498199 RepID=UPI003F81814F
MTRPKGRGTRDRGSEPLELAIVVPGILLIIGTVIAAGLVALAHHRVTHAAHEAARTASVSRTHAEAQRTATAAAQTALRGEGMTCINPSVRVDPAGFRTAPGMDGVVTVHVSCTVSWSALGLQGVTGERTVTAQATSPLDRYRERDR